MAIQLIKESEMKEMNWRTKKKSIFKRNETKTYNNKMQFYDITN